MKKSLIGMLLLGIMILTRAWLIEEKDDIQNELTRADSFVMTQNEYLALQTVEILPKQSLLLSFREINTTDLKNDVPGVQINAKDQQSITSPSNLIASSSSVKEASIESEEMEEEVIPMDYVSNTGYGSWNPGLSSEESEAEGNYPLDRGNTISDNISKLFPLKSPY